MMSIMNYSALLITLHQHYLLIIYFFASVYARPLFGLFDSSDSATSSDTPTSVSDDQISNFVRPLEFARLAYCDADTVQNLTCGQPCSELGSGVQILQIGGNNQQVPMYFIALDNSTQSVVVAHQGTDPFQLLSDANDLQIVQEGLNGTFFPQSASNSSIQVHQGFQDTFERTAADVLSGVQNALASTGFNKVAVTGHSLGAAVATFDAMMLTENLDPSVAISTVVFGLPRAGNQAWADLVDATIGGSFTHVTNQDDPVPIVPPQDFAGLVYQQPSNEVHIVSSTANFTNAITCPGQENENCSAGNSLLDFNVPDHLGLYFKGISVGSGACPDNS